MKPARSVSLSRKDRVICPKCGKHLVCRSTFTLDGGLVTCVNREQGKTCGQALYIIAGHGVVTVVQMSRDELQELADKDAVGILEALGVLDLPLLAHLS